MNLAKHTSESKNREDNKEAEGELKNQDLAGKLRLKEPIFDCFRLEGYQFCRRKLKPFTYIALVASGYVTDILVSQIRRYMRSFMHFVIKIPLDPPLIQSSIDAEEKFENFWQYFESSNKNSVLTNYK
ncbi:unnamed protein product [Hymenolepis diminuta]|uniref:Uncharacterized protein n=1 Tax=Hymenolepis diminuta TaxID=6216 RepID=A0A564ZDH1_HYMDI|nr:unnamed protein product [Hymenolepis diminuta]